MGTAERKSRPIKPNNSLSISDRNRIVAEILPRCVSWVHKHFGKKRAELSGDGDLEGRIAYQLLRMFPSFDPSRGSVFTWAIWQIRSMFAKENQRFRTRERFISRLHRYEPQALQNVAVQRNRHSVAVTDELEAYRKTLTKLDERRRLIVLRYESGYTLEEISEVVCVSKERVRQLLDSAIMRIRKELGLQVDDDRSRSMEQRRIRHKNYCRERDILKRGKKCG